MNVSLMSIGADTYKKGSVFVGGLPMLQNNGLKSTQEKLERQQKAQNEVSFWEKQKDSLKNMECDTAEDIAKKLDALHSYEDEIAAAKKAFNNEQMWHVLDEAEERGEKIAEAAKEMEPKTAEERQKELEEEALGTDEEKGALDEMLEEVTDMAEETEELVEDAAKTLEEVQDMKEQTQEAKEETENLKQSEVQQGMTQESQQAQEDKGALEELSEEIQNMQKRQQEQTEGLLAARQLNAYSAAGNRYLYQAMDLKV